MARLITDAERRAGLLARHHLDGRAADVATAIRDVVAMHSSDPLTPHLGLRARVPGYRPADLEALLPVRLWRLHAMRRTLWVVDGAEVAAMDAAAGRTVATRERKRLVGWVSALDGDGDALISKVTELVIDAVRAEPGITTRRLTRAVPELATRITVGSGKWTTEAAIGARLLNVLAMDLRLVRTGSSGTWKGSQYGWQLAPPVAAIDPAQARTALIRRYLERFAPVTTTDVRWWTGLTAAQVRKALGELAAQEVGLRDGTGWMLPDQALPAPAETGVVTLLPGLDPTPMGYKQRAFFLSEHGAALFDRNGNIGPTVWLDGAIVGGWAVNAAGEVRHRLLQPVGRAASGRVQSACEDLRAWLDGMSITPRFRTPLERELAG